MVYILFLQIGVLLSDALALYFRGKMGFFNSIGVRFTNYLSFLCGYGIIYFFIKFQNYYLELKLGIAVSRKNEKFATGFMALAILLLSINLFQPFLYMIDEQNLYSRLPLYPLIHLYEFVLLFLVAVQLRRYYSKLDRIEKLPFLLFIIIPVVTLILASVSYGIVYGQIGTTISVLIMFVLLQMEQNKQMIDQEELLVQSRIQTTLSQIRPHFLYNTISTIGVLCEEDAVLASEACDRFAAYLRVNLDSISQNKLVPFEKELDHVKTYLWLENLRFGEDLVVTYDLDAVDFRLPALTVQPIVENSVKHGLMGRDGVCHITISSKQVGEEIMITVKDDGIGFHVGKEQESAAHKGVGLENVRERLRYMAHGTLAISSFPGIGTTVTIMIPEEEPEK